MNDLQNEDFVLSRRKRYWVGAVFSSIAMTILAIAIASSIVGKLGAQPDEWIVPFGYTGAVKIYYGVPGSPPVEIDPESGARLFKINTGGFLITSSSRIVVARQFARISMARPDGSVEILRWCFRQRTNNIVPILQ